MENLDFWLAAGGMTLGVAGLLWISARAATHAEAADPAATTPDSRKDLQVYRDQLREIEREVAAGRLIATEAERLRVEIARRLLEADRKARDSIRPSSSRSGLWAIALALGLAGAGALYTYGEIGLPGYPDMPLQSRLDDADRMKALRPSQASYLAEQPAPPQAEPDGEYLELLTKLREAVDPKTSTDLRGLQLLAHNEGAIGNFDAAIAAQSQIIAVKGDAASADDYSDLAELLIRQAQGYISPEAESALTATLRKDPNHSLARYLSGLMFAQNNRFDRAFALWRPLMGQDHGDAAWAAALERQIVDVARMAGVNYTPPESGARPGPTAGDIEASANLSEEERRAMIEGMVAQLSTRLAEAGGSPDEWARLIHALGVLGRIEEGQAIMTEAMSIYENNPEARELIKRAGQSLEARQ